MLVVHDACEYQVFMPKPLDHGIEQRHVHSIVICFEWEAKSTNGSLTDTRDVRRPNMTLVEACRQASQIGTPESGELPNKVLAAPDISRVNFVPCKHAFHTSEIPAGSVNSLCSGLEDHQRPEREARSWELTSS